MSGKRKSVQATLFGQSPVPKVHKGGRLYDDVLNLFVHLNAKEYASKEKLYIAAQAYWSRIKKGGIDGNKDISEAEQFVKKKRPLESKGSMEGFFVKKQHSQGSGSGAGSSTSATSSPSTISVCDTDTPGDFFLLLKLPCVLICTHVDYVLQPAADADDNDADVGASNFCLLLPRSYLVKIILLWASRPSDITNVMNRLLL